MKNNQSERKKSSMPLRINRRSFLGVLSLIAQELIESISTKLKQWDIIISSKVIQHDMDARPLFPKFVVFA